MRPEPHNLKKNLQGDSGGEEPEIENDSSSSSEDEDHDGEDAEESDDDDGEAEEIEAHEARMEELREENRRLVAISEEADRQLVNEMQQRDEVLQRIRDLERNISDLRRRRDDRNLN